ncbi:MAG: YdiU family protein [Gammaproteobacteria bacterium]
MPLPKFENSFESVSEHFFTRIHPSGAPEPEFIRLNSQLAGNLGIHLDWLGSPSGLAMLSGNKLPDSAIPIAMVYAGHQFSHWVPQLGDGRAHLIGELISEAGIRFDIQLKGSGSTPYSRGGDGKAALGPVLREYIVSEWFYAMGIPSTRSLAAVTTGEQVYREIILPGAILTRVAQSHIRVGTFQFFASLNDLDSVNLLADYLIDRHFPELRNHDNPYLSLFEAIAFRQAKLIAQWMGVGFIHGVMNTDNMQLIGETIDFGPCAFMDSFRYDKVFSSIDKLGRYAWNRQPKIACWNLARLAETLLPLFSPDYKKSFHMAERVLGDFNNLFDHEYASIFSAKLGIEAGSTIGGFITKTLDKMEQQKIDFNLFFRRLTQVAGGDDERILVELFSDYAAGYKWLSSWQDHWNIVVNKAAALARMKNANPVYIPRNHRIEQVIDAAYQGNFDPFNELVDLLTYPRSEKVGMEHYELPPEPHEIVVQTFCGT